MITRLYRIATLLAMAAVLALLLGRVPGAYAGSPVAYVDGDTNRACASLTPCYTTIQDGVDHVGGPGDAEVKVFPGTYNENVDLGQMASAFNHVPGNLTLRSVDAQGDPAPGAIVHGASPILAASFGNDVTLDGFVLHATQEDGAKIVTSGAITIASSTATNPGNGTGGDGDDGFDLKTTGGGLVVVHDSEATGAHGQLGDGFQIVSSGGVSMHNINANDNGGTQDNIGVNIFDSVGDVNLDAITASNNTELGIYVYTAGNITLTNSTADSNSVFFGVQLTADLPVTAAAGSAGAATSDITVSGLEADNSGDDGLFAQAYQGNVSVDNTITNNNQSRGMSLLTGGGEVHVIGSRMEGNRDEGLYVEGTDAVTLDRDGVMNNGDNNTPQGGVKITDGGSGGVGPVTIHDSLVQDNTGQGIDLFNLDEAATHSITSNVICGNSVGGLRNNGTLITVPAEGNWWGSSNGPTSPQNPGGDGDKTNFGGDGTIDFAHWIDRVEMTELAGPAAVVGQAETLAFVFTDHERVYQLQNGPGDGSSGGVFGVTTDNGTLSIGTQSGATVYGNIANARLDAGYVPAHTGNAHITLDGPCDLSLQTTISAESGGPWGDVDCSGQVAAPDLLRSLRYQSGAALEEIDGCGIAPAVFDIDCNGLSDGRDPLLLALYLADVPPTFSVPIDCPGVGS